MMRLAEGQLQEWAELARDRQSYRDEVILELIAEVRQLWQDNVLLATTLRESKGDGR